MNLFDEIDQSGDQNDKDRPLATRMRPNSLDEFVGQKDLVGEGKNDSPYH